MEAKYTCKKSTSFGLLLLITCVFIGFVAIGLPLFMNGAMSISVLLASVIFTVVVYGFFLWVWFGTIYIIGHDVLIAQSGPMKWKVPIKDILFIRLNQKTIGGTWKPTLSWDCIEIRYKKYRAIFISPEKQESFINQLKTINDQIEIKRKLPNSDCDYSTKASHY